MKYHLLLSQNIVYGIVYIFVQTIKNEYYFLLKYVFYYKNNYKQV